MTTQAEYYQDGDNRNSKTSISTVYTSGLVGDVKNLSV